MRLFFTSSNLTDEIIVKCYLILRSSDFDGKYFWSQVIKFSRSMFTNISLMNPLRVNGEFNDKDTDCDYII